MYEVSYEEGILWQKVQVAYYIYAAGGRRLQTRGRKYTTFKIQSAFYAAAPTHSQVCVTAHGYTFLRVALQGVFYAFVFFYSGQICNLDKLLSHPGSSVLLFVEISFPNIIIYSGMMFVRCTCIEDFSGPNTDAALSVVICLVMFYTSSLICSSLSLLPTCFPLASISQTTDTVVIWTAVLMHSCLSCMSLGYFYPLPEVSVVPSGHCKRGMKMSDSS